MISNRVFSNYKFTSKQREAVNWQLLFVSVLMCIQLFETLVEIKNWNRKSSSLKWYIRRRRLYHQELNVKNSFVWSSIELDIHVFIVRNDYFGVGLLWVLYKSNLEFLALKTMGTYRIPFSNVALWKWRIT